MADESNYKAQGFVCFAGAGVLTFKTLGWLSLPVTSAWAIPIGIAYMALMWFLFEWLLNLIGWVMTSWLK